MKSDFEIPFDVKNDLAYCKRALHHHIAMFQKVSSSRNMPEMRKRKSMKEIENEILDIGNEQKLLFNRLRFYIDCHQLNKNISMSERRILTNHIRDELMSYTESVGDDIRPKNAQMRLGITDLLQKYSSRAIARLDGIDDASPNGMTATHRSKQNSTDDDDDDSLMYVDAEPANDNARTAVKRMSIQKMDMNLSSGSGKPESLLKPIDQRPKLDGKPVSPPKQIDEKQPPQVNQARNKLRQALFKAIDESNGKKQKIEDLQIRITTDSPDMVSHVPSPNSITAISSASNSSSEDMAAVKDEETVYDLGQERFLKLFSLGTPAFVNYLQNRRPQRKKRNCTSTERNDFHYGKYELYERQFAKNRSKRAFLYSPPATRAKRRTASNAEKPEIVVPEKKDYSRNKVVTAATVKTNPSATIVSNNKRVCLICWKQNGLMQCKHCQGQYHVSCHNNNTNSMFRNNLCPVCCKGKAVRRSKNNETGQIILSVQ